MLENNLKNKMSFFAQHFGQRVWRYNHTNGESNLLYIDATTIKNKKQFGFTGHLELKHLSMLTVLEATEIAKIHCAQQYVDLELGLCNMQETIKSNHEIFAIRFTAFEVTRHLGDLPKSFLMYISTWGTINVYVNNELSNNVKAAEIYDLLRSKEYLLPYMGTPSETLVEYGWAKIKRL